MPSLPLTVTPLSGDRGARAIMLRGNTVAVRILSDNWAVLAAATLMALGYEGLRLELHSGNRTIDESTVQAVVRNIPGTIFLPAPPRKGLVVLTERYSEAFNEHRYSVSVNGRCLEDSLSARQRWQDITSLHHILNA